ARATHRRKADAAEDRAQTSDVADPSQTVSPQDAVFFPLALHARPPYWAIYEPGGIRPCSIKRTKYQVGTLPSSVMLQISSSHIRSPRMIGPPVRGGRGWSRSLCNVPSVKAPR